MGSEATFPPFWLVLVLQWWKADSRQGLSHLTVQLLPTHEKRKHDFSDEISKLVRQQQGDGDQKWDKNPTSLQIHL